MVFLEGFLVCGKKKGWYRLAGRALYFSDKPGKPVVGEIALDGATRVLADADDERGFGLHGADGSLRAALRAPTPRERDEWVAGVRAALREGAVLDQQQPAASVVRVFAKDGSYKSLAYTPATTAVDLCREYLVKLRIPSAHLRAFRLREVAVADAAEAAGTDVDLNELVADVVRRTAVNATRLVFGFTDAAKRKFSVSLAGLPPRPPRPAGPPGSPARARAPLTLPHPLQPSPAPAPAPARVLVLPQRPIQRAAGVVAGGPPARMPAPSPRATPAPVPARPVAPGWPACAPSAPGAPAPVPRRTLAQRLPPPRGAARAPAPPPRPLPPPRPQPPPPPPRSALQPEELLAPAPVPAPAPAPVPAPAPAPAPEPAPEPVPEPVPPPPPHPHYDYGDEIAGDQAIVDEEALSELLGDSLRRMQRVSTVSAGSGGIGELPDVLNDVGVGVSQKPPSEEDLHFAGNEDIDPDDVLAFLASEFGPM